MPGPLAIRRITAPMGVTWLLMPLLVVLSGELCGQDALSGKTAQVRIVDVIWGFDGRVSAGYFQPLSLLLDNLSGDVIEGTVSIRLSAGFSREGHGAQQQPVYLGGQSRRWVQFYPYVTDVTDSWTVELQTEAGRFELQSLDPPRLAVDPAWYRIQQAGGQAGGQANATKSSEQNLPAVFLDPPRKQDRQPTTVRHMPAEIFPPYSTATGGLHAVFLDHVPDWEEPRQQAFLAWLRRGGHLHLLLDDNRRELVFQGPLAVLNEPLPEFSVDSGTVYREDIQRQELSEERVNAVVRESLKPDADEDLQMRDAASMGMGFSTLNLLNDDDLFALMREVVEPQHAWALIALLSFVYIFALYPGIWRLSNATRFSPLKTISAVLGLSAVFSLLFLWLGRRGYGETESLQTLMVASAEDQRHWNCLQFTQLFGTDGGTYQLSDQNHQALLSCGTRLDRSDSLIQPGNTATMTARLAPYSTETVTLARRLELADWRVRIDRQQLQGSTLATLELGLGPDFPFAEDTLCLAVVGKTAYEMTLNEQQGKATLKGNSRILLSDLLWKDSVPAVGWWTSGVAPDPELGPWTTEERQRSRLLIRRAMAARGLVPGRLQVGPGAVMLVVEAALPDEFRLKFDPEVPETGRVLYVKTLSLASEPPL